MWQLVTMLKEVKHWSHVNQQQQRIDHHARTMKKQKGGCEETLCCRKNVLISVDRQQQRRRRRRRRGGLVGADFIDENNHSLSLIAVSRKRRLYQANNLDVTVDKAPRITSATTNTMMPKRRRPSLLLLTAVLILATAEFVSSSLSSSFGITEAIDNNDHETSEAFWQDGAIDDDKIHPLLSMEQVDDEFENRDSKHTFERTPSLRRHHHQQQQAQNERSQIQREQQPHSSSLLRQKQQQSTSRQQQQQQQQQQQSRQLQVEREQERNRKDRIAADFHFPSTTSDKRHRILIECNHYGEVFHVHHHYSQDACLSGLLSLYGGDGGGGTNNNTNHNNNHHNNPIEVIHNLESIHAISIEVDTQTLTDIVLDGQFVYHNDFVRRPLVIEGSMGYYNPPSSLPSSTPASNSNRKLLTEYQEIPWGLSAIKAQEVWEGFGVKGEGVTVCILDTGIQASHEDFRESHLNGYYGNEFISPYWYEDSKGHGTHVAGTITASDNSIGIVGIAPESETYIVRVFDDSREFYGFADGTAYSTDLIAAATICKERGADIISASLGGSSYNEIEETFFQRLFYESGIITVAASGNGGNDQNVYPAAYDGVLSVGAVDESLNLAGFSTWNRETTDVLAPGVNILSTFKGNDYRTFSGTSMAAPHATGALALMLSYVKNKTEQDFTAQDVFHAIKNTLVSTYATVTDRVEEISISNDDNKYPIGTIDVYAAIQYLESDDDKRQVVEGRTGIIPEREALYNSIRRCANEVRLEISTDSKGYETYYRLKRLSDDQIIWMTRPNTLDSNSNYSETSCLEIANDCYRFDIRDNGGDGIAGTDGGGIELFYDGQELYRGGNFARGGMLEFGSGC